ncbi:MAG TPA: flagellar motor switch protein FliN [Thermoguttaceae bacterium]|nr:flagellar motor switch protein FliN [Thermoguttaceae bacterium]
MADDNAMGQDEIEALLSQAGGGSSSDKSEAAAPSSSEPASALDQGDIEALLSGGGGGAGSPADAEQPSPPKGESPPAPTAVTAAPDDDKLLGQDDIEKLLNQAQGGDAAPKPAAQPDPAREMPTRPGASSGDDVAQEDIEYLLSQAEQALESINQAATEELPDGVAAFRLEEFAGAAASTEATTMDLVRDVGLDLKIELGRTHMYLEDVLKLRKGSVVPLDKLAGDPVDIFVNGRLIARGEVLVLNDNFCVRVAELIAGENVHA